MSDAVHVLFGDDEYLVSTKAREIVAGLVPEDQQALGLDIVDGDAGTVDDAVQIIGACRASLNTPGFMGTGRVTWLRGANFLSDTVVGRSETVKAALAPLAADIKGGLIPGQALVVTATKIDKRYAFYKACNATGTMYEYGIPSQGYKADQQAATRLRECLSEAGLSMSQQVQQQFLEKVGTDTRQIVSEVVKLATYLGDPRAITREDVETVTSTSRDALAWDLADAFGEGKADRALRICRRLLFQRENGIALVSIIEGRIRDLMIYREAMDAGWLKRGRGRGSVEWAAVPPHVDAMLSHDFPKDPRKTHPFRVGILARQAATFSMAKLRRGHRLAVRARGQLVSARLPEAIVVEMLLIRALA